MTKPGMARANADTFSIPGQPRFNNCLGIHISFVIPTILFYEEHGEKLRGAYSSTGWIGDDIQRCEYRVGGSPA